MIPVKVALGSIYREARAVGIEGSISVYRNRVDAGLQRVLAFATELHETARLSGEERTAFDASAAIRDAIAVLQGEG